MSKYYFIPMTIVPSRVIAHNTAIAKAIVRKDLDGKLLFGTRSDALCQHLLDTKSVTNRKRAKAIGKTFVSLQYEHLRSTLVFSAALDVPKVVDMNNYCPEKSELQRVGNIAKSFDDRFRKMHSTLDDSERVNVTAKCLRTQFTLQTCWILQTGMELFDGSGKDEHFTVAYPETLQQDEWWVLFRDILRQSNCYNFIKEIKLF